MKNFFVSVENIVEFVQNIKKINERQPIDFIGVENVFRNRFRIVDCEFLFQHCFFEFFFCFVSQVFPRFEAFIAKTCSEFSAVESVHKVVTVITRPKRWTLNANYTVIINESDEICVKFSQIFNVFQNVQAVNDVEFFINIIQIFDNLI